ncbi:outer kinetochore KNL1 complex subunit ZWINT [Ctenodactylus gundi]
MEGRRTNVEAAALKILSEVANIVEPTGLQEEAEVPAQILAEFVRNSRKKDKLLCSQLQVVDFLQNFLAQKDTDCDLDSLASEDTSRQKAIAAKEEWKELKATYQELVEAIKVSLTQALFKMEEAQGKLEQLQEAVERFQTKVHLGNLSLEGEDRKRGNGFSSYLTLPIPYAPTLESYVPSMHEAGGVGIAMIFEPLVNCICTLTSQEKHLQNVAEASSQVKLRQAGAQQEVERLSRELQDLKEQADQKQDELKRLQTSLKLLYALQGKLQLSKAEGEGEVTTGISPLPGSP